MKGCLHMDSDQAELTAPSGGVLSGAMVVIGGLLGIVIASVAQGEIFQMRLRGVFKYAKKTTDDVSEGDALYFDESEDELTLTEADNRFAGYAVADAGTSASEVQILLPGAAPKAKNVAALTVGTLSGTANGAMESIGATNSGDVSGAISNNFKECFTQINSILDALVDAGMMKAP